MLLKSVIAFVHCDMLLFKMCMNLLLTVECVGHSVT